MTTTATKWRQIRAFRGGHRFFIPLNPSAAVPSGTYLADDSGETPDTTEDGPLRVDLSPDVGIYVWNDGTFAIPVIGRKGSSVTPCGLREALYVREVLGVPVIETEYVSRLRRLMGRQS